MEHEFSPLVQVYRDVVKSYGFHFAEMVRKYRNQQSFVSDAVCLQRDAQLLGKYFGIPSKILLEGYSRALKRLEAEYLIGKRKREEEARKRVMKQLEFKEKLNSLYYNMIEERKKLIEEAKELGIEIADPEEVDPL